LAKVMRRELKKRNIGNVKVVYSKEEPVEAKISLKETEMQESSRRSVPASCAFVPSVAGLILAGEVIKDLAGNNKKG
jgi:tRNA A37 threonylcarbamoyladenosine dehydratase